MSQFSRLLASAVLLVTALSLCAQQGPSSTALFTPRVKPPSPEMSIADLEEEGDALRAEKDYLDAMDYYRVAVKKSGTAALHNKMGVCWIQLSRYGDARKEFEQAIKLDGGYPEAHNNLGVAHYQLRHYGTAVKEYKKAIKLRETSASFHLNLGSAYFSRQDFDDAGKEFNRALQIDPLIFDPQPSGGVSVKLASHGDRAFFHYTLAKMYGARGDLERCQLYLSKANEEGYPFVRDALKDSGFAAVRKDPNFVAFVRSLKPVSQDAAE
ncbi:MAG TPA: tetratricopeptide repeat protein [Verrucomicrobiae bacterium]|jgi:tetratricopeptide (TPR) repeat protein|nr:tetratricopeptide repeat protein [Verrucomicrobiae bacterium]